MVTSLQHRLHLSDQAWYWLGYTGSLTERLRQTFGDRIEFRLIHQGWESTTTPTTWIRHIEWLLDREKIITGRTFIPSDHPLLSLIRLQLGAQPIGDILFPSDRFIPSPIDEASLMLTDSGWTRTRTFSDTLNRHDDNRIVVLESFSSRFIIHHASYGTI